ncbi:MAG: RNA-binding protein [Lachnospiraceae bacterium]|nr:RNA-binding protein [Lachnospiraceae bacterium]
MRPGEYKSLKIIKFTDFGCYLAEDDKSEERVLLPKAQLPKEAKTGDEMRVFLYLDSKDRLIATVNKPLITLGKLAALKVVDTGKIGAFLDWGLEKDLLLPFGEMEGTPKIGDKILVTLYIDKSGRLCASQRHLYHLMSQNSPYIIGDDVSGRVYEFSDNFGTFVAVDDKYSAMLPKSEGHDDLKIGDVILARVTAVKEDGKLDITRREKAHIQMDKDAENLLKLIDSYAGVLPFTEKATPEVIMRETGLSKAAFKRAVGRLYKERRIDISDGKIRKV